MGKLTISSMEKPLVHFIKSPELRDVCFTGKENVNPSSLVETGESFPSFFSTNCLNDAAIKSNSSCKDSHPIW